MPLTDEQIKALRDGCEGVTPGPWMQAENRNYGVHVKMDKGSAFILIASDIGDLDDAAHLARCDPDTIRELCDRLLAAEARVKVLEDALTRIANTTEGDADLDEYGAAEFARKELERTTNAD